MCAFDAEVLPSKPIGIPGTERYGRVQTADGNSEIDQLQSTRVLSESGIDEIKLLIWWNY